MHLPVFPADAYMAAAGYGASFVPHLVVRKWLGLAHHKSCLFQWFLYVVSLSTMAYHDEKERRFGKSVETFD